MRFRLRCRLRVRIRFSVDLSLRVSHLEGDDVWKHSFAPLSVGQGRTKRRVGQRQLDHAPFDFHLGCGREGGGGCLGLVVMEEFRE